MLDNRHNCPFDLLTYRTNTLTKEQRMQLRINTQTHTPSGEPRGQPPPPVGTGAPCCFAPSQTAQLVHEFHGSFCICLPIRLRFPRLQAHSCAEFLWVPKIQIPYGLSYLLSLLPFIFPNHLHIWYFP